MASSVTIEILPHKVSFAIDMDPDTTINELLDYIKNQQNINSDIKNWTCYSDLKRMFLDHNWSFGDTIKYDKFIINTQPNEKQSTQESYNNNFLNNNKYVQQQPPYSLYQQNQSQNKILYETYSQQDSSQQLKYASYIKNKYQIEEAKGSQKSVIINFEITNRNMKCKLQCTYRGDDIIEALADTVLAYLRVSKQRASCDLFIYGLSLNNYNTRFKPLWNTQRIISGMTVDAHLRWIKCKI